MNLFELGIKLFFDTDALENDSDAKKKSEAEGEKAGHSWSTGFKKAAKVAAAAVAVGAGLVAAFSKKAIEGYAEYEQLVGGVETLFKDSSDKVQQYAANAFKTAGLSANDYMETVTSFSASLLQSLGGDTEKAASYADMAITDMSDNANKMGTSMESIQSAYQGFAKQNYTMLDNLKLGYGGTKTEMERLITDAEKLNKNFKASRKTNGDLTMSYADIVDAIHIVQDNMGITGTTAAEAEKTISGSLNSLKAAWSNLIVGVADDTQDFDKLMGNLVDSAKTAAKNILPRIATALKGIGKLIQGLAPVITEAVPILVSDVLPSLIAAAGTLVSTLASAIIENLPAIFDVGLDLVKMLADGIINNLPAVITAITDIVITIAKKLTDGETIAQLVVAAIQIMTALASGLVSNIPRLIREIPKIIKSIVEGIVAHWDEIKEAGGDLIDQLAEGARQLLIVLWEVGGEAVDKIREGIHNTWSKIKEAGRGIIDRAKEGIQSKWQDMKTAGSDLITKVVDGIKSFYEKVKAAGSDIVNNVVDGIKRLWSNLTTAGQDSVNKIVEGIRQALSAAWSVGSEVVNSLISGLSSSWGNLTSWIKSAWRGLFSGLSGKVTVDADGNVTAYSKASGIDYVPYHNYPAILHKGEAVLNATEAEKWRRGETNPSNAGFTIIQNIQSVPQTPVEFAATTEAYFEQARWAMA